jgi:hypothetical protein
MADLKSFVDLENELRQALAAELVEPELELVTRLARSRFALLQTAGDTIGGGGLPDKAVICKSAKDCGRSISSSRLRWLTGSDRRHIPPRRG